MKKIYMMLLAAIIVMPVFAGEKLRVAVFDPTSSGTAIDEGMKVAIREIISSTFVNSGNYDIVERSLLEKVMQEQQFSNSGVVNDNDATEIGKLAGANKIVLSVVTLTEHRYMISVKMIDVKTANIEKQKVKIIEAGRLLENIEPIALSLLGTEDESQTSNPEPEAETPAYTPAPVPDNTPNNVTKVLAKKRAKARYSGMVDFEASFIDNPSIGVSTTHGCQIRPYLFVGAGFGVYYLYGGYYSEFSTPIYANVRGCIPTKKITPFAELRAGYDFYWDGIYLAPAIGITVRKLEFSIGFTTEFLPESDYYEYDDDYYYEQNIDGLTLTIKVGLKF